jgi:hypothetical protein
LLLSVASMVSAVSVVSAAVTEFSAIDLWSVLRASCVSRRVLWLSEHWSSKPLECVVRYCLAWVLLGAADLSEAIAEMNRCVLGRVLGEIESRKERRRAGREAHWCSIASSSVGVCSHD